MSKFITPDGITVSVADKDDVHMHPPLFTPADATPATRRTPRRGARAPKAAADVPEEPTDV